MASAVPVNPALLVNPWSALRLSSAQLSVLKSFPGFALACPSIRAASKLNKCSASSYCLPASTVFYTNAACYSYNNYTIFYSSADNYLVLSNWVFKISLEKLAYD